jgi:hypothetical protein
VSIAIQPRLNFPITRAWNTDVGAEIVPVSPVIITDKDSQGISGDNAFYDPFYWRIDGAKGRGRRQGYLGLAQNIVHTLELYAASFTPKGWFTTHIAPRNALRMGWRFVPQKKSAEVLRPRLHKTLIEMSRLWKIKKNVISAVQVSETFSRSLLYRRQVAPRGKKMRWELFVTRIPDEWVTYDEDTNEIIEYNPIVGWGRGLRRLTIKPEDAVLFMAETDPMGNGYQAIPPLLPIYRTIQRMENISESWAEIVNQRGLGLIDMTVEGAKKEKDLEPYGKKYGNPSSYSLIAHNERVKVQAIEGLRASFNLDETIGRYTKDVASGTGFPSMRMEGVQTGTVTGSETDQDNMAENYSVLQERYEPFIIETYLMLNNELIDERFELEFEYDIKLDRFKQAELFNLNSNSIQMNVNFMTIDQALEMLRLPTIGGPIGQLSVAQYEEWKANQPIPGLPRIKLKPKETEDKPDEGEKEGDVFRPLTKDQITDWISEAINDEGADENDIIEGLLHFGYFARNEKKNEVGEILANAADSQENELSYGKINYILISVFGSGKSNNDIKKWRH